MFEDLDDDFWIEFTEVLTPKVLYIKDLTEKTKSEAYNFAWELVEKEGAVWLKDWSGIVLKE